MCQIVPRRVLQVGDRRAEVLYDDVPTWIAVLGIPDVRVGEYLVVYAGQALERLPTAEAEEMLAFTTELDRMFAEAVG